MYWNQLLATSVPERHLVQLYQADERFLIRNVSRYLWEGLKHGDGLVVVATAAHIGEIALELKALEADTEAAEQAGKACLLRRPGNAPPFPCRRPA
jgi:hypothetical protein